MSVIIDGKESYVGCVIDTYERNGYNDSDFYATVVDVESGTVKDIEYDSTRHGGTGCAFIDITLENYTKYLHIAKHSYYKEYIEREVKEAKTIVKGKTVKVVRGRKVPIGTVGTIFWSKEDKYGVGYQSKEVVRIGIKDERGNVHWTYAHNVEVASYKQYVRKPQYIIKEAKRVLSKKYLLLKEMSAN